MSFSSFRFPRVRLRPVAAAFLGAVALCLILLRLVQIGLPKWPPEVDPGLVALFAPLCALVLAITIEAALLIGRHPLPEDVTPLPRPIPHWAGND